MLTFKYFNLYFSQIIQIIPVMKAADAFRDERRHEHAPLMLS